MNIIQNLAHHRTKSELRRALKKMCYYRAYISKLVQTAKPLTILTTNNTPMTIRLGKEQQKAFEYLKEACTEGIYVWGTIFLAHDASCYAVGCCLGQWVTMCVGRRREKGIRLHVGIATNFVTLSSEPSLLCL